MTRWNAAIDELEAVEINQDRQWLLYRGDRRDRSILLWIHGGPGFPLMGLSRAFDGPYLQDFVVVHWDQRGAGKSYNPAAPTRPGTLQQTVDDGLAVVDHLQAKFGHSPVVLAGHSWGTAIASLMAAARPSAFQAYVSVGTVGHMLRCELHRHGLLESRIQERGDMDAAAALQRLGPPPYRTHEEFARFGAMIIEQLGTSGTFRQLTVAQVEEAFSRTCEYSPTEMTAMHEGLKVSIDHVADAVNAFIAWEAVPRLEVPVFFIQGAHDLNTPSQHAREYFDVLDASRGKEWHPAPESAHFPMYEDPGLCLRVLRDAAAR